MFSDVDLPAKLHTYKLLYESSPLCYQSLDKNGTIIIVNPAWCKLFGNSQDEVIGKRFGDFLAPESKKKRWNVFQNLYPLVILAV